MRYAEGMLTLDMGNEGYGRDRRSIQLSELRDLRVLSDTTMVEIFANGGEAALTSRTYSPAVSAMGLHAEGAASMDLSFSRINRAWNTIGLAGRNVSQLPQRTTVYRV